MRLEFLKQLWEWINSTPGADTSKSSDTPLVSTTSSGSSRASSRSAQLPTLASRASSRSVQQPTLEHTKLTRKPNVITKMESGLGRTLTDAERNRLLNKDRADKSAETKEALQKYSAREKSKFDYTFKPQEKETK